MLERGKQKAMKFFKIFNILLCLISLSACELFDGDQSDADLITQALALTGTTYVDFFQDSLANCQDFAELFAALETDLQTCDNGDEGTFRSFKQDFFCEAIAPIEARAEFLLVQENCQDDSTELTSTGEILIQLEFSTDGNFANLSSEELITDRGVAVFQDFRVQVNFATNTLSCSESEDIEINSQICRVRSNCESCQL